MNYYYYPGLIKYWQVKLAFVDNLINGFCGFNEVQSYFWTTTEPSLDNPGFILLNVETVI